MTRWKPICCLAVAAGGLLALAPLAAFNTPSGPSGVVGGEVDNPALARRMAGTYYMTFTTQPLRALVTFHADGTLSGSDTSDFGVAGRSLESPIRGVWRPIGQRQAAAAFLGFAFDPATGEHIATLRARGEPVFDAELQSFRVEATAIDIFEPHQDPTDPEAEPFLSVVEPLVTANRLNLGM